jgi:hypothetical protein
MAVIVEVGASAVNVPAAARIATTFVVTRSGVGAETPLQPTESKQNTNDTMR